MDSGQNENENQSNTNNMENRTMEQLIIERNPETKIAYQIAKQMHGCLPIKSFEELEKALSDGLIVDDQRLKMEMFKPYIPKGIFPIKDAQDLITKVSSATMIALDSITKRSANIVKLSPVQEILKTALNANDEQRTSIPAGHFTGPSIYGYELSKKH